MQDKRKLMAVITGAISAYIQMEQLPLLAAQEIVTEVRLQPEISWWKIAGRLKLTTVDRKIGL